MKQLMSSRLFLLLMKTSKRKEIRKSPISAMKNFDEFIGIPISLFKCFHQAFFIAPANR